MIAGIEREWSKAEGKKRERGGVGGSEEGRKGEEVRVGNSRDGRKGERGEKRGEVRGGGRKGGEASEGAWGEGGGVKEM